MTNPWMAQILLVPTLMTPSSPGSSVRSRDMVVSFSLFRLVSEDDVGVDRAEDIESRLERKVMGGLAEDEAIVHGHRAYRWNNAVPGYEREIECFVERFFPAAARRGRDSMLTMFECTMILTTSPPDASSSTKKSNPRWK